MINKPWGKLVCDVLSAVGCRIASETLDGIFGLDTRAISVLVQCSAFQQGATMK
jgi:hypothetical protein